MKLYFFRHGHAEDADGPEFDDFARRLTVKGVERSGAAGRALLRLGVRPIRVFSSPRVRARQTADLLTEALGMSVSVRDELNFGFNVEHVGDLIADLGAEEEVLFVGHEPDLSIVISMLVGGGEIVLKKGGLARVDVSSREPLRGALIWLLSPSLLDALAEGK
jgi:phosphohistidine phosphatase